MSTVRIKLKTKKVSEIALLDKISAEFSADKISAEFSADKIFGSKLDL